MSKCEQEQKKKSMVLNPHFIALRLDLSKWMREKTVLTVSCVDRLSQSTISIVDLSLIFFFSTHFGIFVCFSHRRLRAIIFLFDLKWFDFFPLEICSIYYCALCVCTVWKCVTYILLLFPFWSQLHCSDSIDCDANNYANISLYFVKLRSKLDACVRLAYIWAKIKSH